MFKEDAPALLTQHFKIFFVIESRFGPDAESNVPRRDRTVEAESQ